MFDHERLDVYQAAIEFVEKANEIIENLPRGNAKLADQLSRASISIPLNIAEGAGLYTKKEKQRAYRIARGSAMECAAILDVCLRLDIVSEDKSRKGKEILLRVVAMLTKLIKSFD